MKKLAQIPWLNLFWVILGMDVQSTGIWKQALAAPLTQNTPVQFLYPSYSPIIARDTQLSLGANNSATRGDVCHYHR